MKFIKIKFTIFKIEFKKKLKTLVNQSMKISTFRIS